jgi:ADP-ribose pyrophosphatase
MSAADRRFEPVGGRTIYDGRILRVVVDRFRFADGDEVEREIVRHKGAAGIVAHDDTHLYLVRQPREALADPDFLEIPAGRLDQEGESPLEAAQRELAEEIGKAASRWERITTYVSSAGMSDEVVHVFHATGLTDSSAESDENERIEIVRWPLARLDELLDTVKDSKSRIGLLELRRRCR